MKRKKQIGALHPQKHVCQLKRPSCSWISFLTNNQISLFPKISHFFWWSVFPSKFIKPHDVPCKLPVWSIFSVMNSSLLTFSWLQNVSRLIFPWLQNVSRLEFITERHFKALKIHYWWNRSAYYSKSESASKILFFISIYIYIYIYLCMCNTFCIFTALDVI